MISFADSRARLSILSALIAVASILSARAQVVDFQKERAPIVEIHDLWRFHTGDDPDGKLGLGQSRLRRLRRGSFCVPTSS